MQTRFALIDARVTQTVSISMDAPPLRQDGLAISHPTGVGTNSSPLRAHQPRNTTVVRTQPTTNSLNCFKAKHLVFDVAVFVDLSGCGCCVKAPASHSTTGKGPAVSLPAISKLTITCSDDSVAEPEGYSLNVAADSVTISASTSQGAAYGLTTLAQLLRYDVDIGSGVLDFVPLHITDAPRFGWRGHMLDTSRHFVPVDEILTLLDGLYAAKLNVFHWHIVDSPSFPMDSKAFPELALQGSWTGTNASIYSIADQERVAQRAKERFIEVSLITI